MRKSGAFSRLTTTAPLKAATAPRRFHPLTGVVFSRRSVGDPAKPLFYPRHGGGTPKRLSFCLDAAAAARQKRFYHPDAAAAAPNDCRFTRTPRRRAGKTAFIPPTRRWHSATTVVLPGNRRRNVGNALFPVGCMIFTHFPS